MIWRRDWRVGEAVPGHRVTSAGVGAVLQRSTGRLCDALARRALATHAESA